jgi:WD40 repeat protein
VSSSPAAPIIAESMHCISMSSFMPFALHYPFYLQAHRANKLQLETQFPHRLFDPTSNVLSDALQRIYAEFCSNASLGPRQRRFVVSASHLSVILARKLLQGSCRTLYPGHRLQHAIRIVSRLHRNVFSPATCFTTLPGSDGAHSVAFHPFLPFLATGSCDNTARVWRFLHPNAVDGLTQSLAVASLAGHSNSVKSVAFHPSLPYLATGSRDGSIKLWSLHCDGTPAAYVATLQGHTSSIKSVAFHPFLPVLASGSANRDNTARVWRFFHPQAASVSSKSLVVASLEEHTVRHADSVKSVSFHPSLPYMATGSRDRTAEWLCLSPDGTPIWPSLTLHGHSSSINSVAFHTTAPILATGSYDGSTKLWKHDGSAVSCVGTLEHAKCIMSVAFHPCVPNVLATGSTDGSAKLWQLRFDEDDELIRHTCKHLVHTDGPIKSVAFHARLPVMATRCHVDGRDTTTLWW